MDSAKLKKLQDYSVFLTQQAESKEAQGNTSEAIKDYVKLVDVLLLLANEAKDHPTWQQLIGRAEFYQKKARSMADPNSTSSNNSSSSVFKSFRKLPSLIGNNKKTNSFNNNLAKEEPSLAGSPTQPTTILSSWSKDLKQPNSRPEVKASIPPSGSSPSTNSSQVVTLQEVKEEEKMVPFSVYTQVLHEKSKLEDEVKALQMKEKEYLNSLEAKEKQLEDTLSSMIPRSEYEGVCSRLENSVPREEYEQALAISSIPKERYAELQARVVELEMKLQNSVPAAIIDEILEYVSFLVSTVAEKSNDQKASTVVEGIDSTITLHG